jgi:periplasmic protein CpxP/Spy
MKNLILIALAAMLGATVAVAQSNQPQGNSAVKSPTPNSDQSSARGAATAATGDARDARLEPGSNSFTEGQARSKIEEAGFQNVTDLKKDEQGIWRAKAHKSGKAVTVGLDFKGNVGTQ